MEGSVQCAVCSVQCAACSARSFIPRHQSNSGARPCEICQAIMNYYEREKSRKGAGSLHKYIIYMKNHRLDLKISFFINYSFFIIFIICFLGHLYINRAANKGLVAGELKWHPPIGLQGCHGLAGSVSHLRWQAMQAWQSWLVWQSWQAWQSWQSQQS